MSYSNPFTQVLVGRRHDATGEQALLYLLLKVLEDLAPEETAGPNAKRDVFKYIENIVGKDCGSLITLRHCLNDPSL